MKATALSLKVQSKTQATLMPAANDSINESSAELTNAGPLREVARAISEDRARDAEATLRHHLAEVERSDERRALERYIFAAALARRLSAKAVAEANLYLNHFEVPQIHLFNLLAHHVPQVSMTTVIANACIAQAIAGQARPTVIDIGIGTGRQIVSLLELLHATKQLPKQMTVIGVEPSDFCLGRADENLRAAAERFGVALSFRALRNVAERLTGDDWARMAALCTGRPAINASFALHHIADVDGRDVRDDVLLRLRSLHPAALVVSEPDVHHLEHDFLARFDNCWRHFGATFVALDRLALSKSDRDALKVQFFGREIADILGNPEDTRSERHERASSWLERLERTGYVPRMNVELPPSGAVISVRNRGDRASLQLGSEPLVAVLCAVPASAR
jgi:hypothetical protein